jgi:hypothetical protein
MLTTSPLPLLATMLLGAVLHAQAVDPRLAPADASVRANVVELSPAPMDPRTAPVDASAQANVAGQQPPGAAVLPQAANAALQLPQQFPSATARRSPAASTWGPQPQVFSASTSMDSLIAPTGVSVGNNAGGPLQQQFLSAAMERSSVPIWGPQPQTFSANTSVDSLIPPAGVSVGSNATGLFWQRLPTATMERSSAAYTRRAQNSAAGSYAQRLKDNRSQLTTRNWNSFASTPLAGNRVGNWRLEATGSLSSAGISPAPSAKMPTRVGQASTGTNGVSAGGEQPLGGWAQSPHFGQHALPHKWASKDHRGHRGQAVAGGSCVTPLLSTPEEKAKRCRATSSRTEAMAAGRLRQRTSPAGRRQAGVYENSESRGGDRSLERNKEALIDAL